VESIVLTHLSRIYDVHYTKAMGEVDAVVKNGEPIGFEVKFGRIRHERRILGRMKRIYILSKDTLGDNVIPVSLFLAMLNIPQTIELKILE